MSEKFTCIQTGSRVETCAGCDWYDCEKNTESPAPKKPVDLGRSTVAELLNEQAEAEKVVAVDLEELHADAKEYAEKQPEEMMQFAEEQGEQPDDEQ